MTSNILNKIDGVTKLQVTSSQYSCEELLAYLVSKNVRALYFEQIYPGYMTTSPQRVAEAKLGNAVVHMMLKTAANERQKELHNVIKVVPMLEERPFTISGDLVSSVNKEGRVETLRVTNGMIQTPESIGGLSETVDRVMWAEKRANGVRMPLTNVDNEFLAVPAIPPDPIDLVGDGEIKPRVIMYEVALDRPTYFTARDHTIAMYFDPKIRQPLPKDLARAVAERWFPDTPDMPMFKLSPYEIPFPPYDAFTHSLFYHYLHQANGMVGGGKRGSSEVQNGYYYASMIRPIARLVAMVADLKSLLIESKSSGIIIDSLIKPYTEPVMRSLTLNGYNVYVKDGSLFPFRDENAEIAEKERKDRRGSIYRWCGESKGNLEIVRTRMWDIAKVQPSQSPPVSFTDKLPTARKALKMFFDENAGKEVATRVYIRDILAEHSTKLYPSTQGDEGFVWLFNHDISNITYDQHVGRMCHAVLARVHFPFSRVPFIKMDKFVPAAWKFVLNITVKARIEQVKQGELQKISGILNEMVAPERIISIRTLEAIIERERAKTGAAIKLHVVPPPPPPVARPAPQVYVPPPTASNAQLTLPPSTEKPVGEDDPDRMKKLYKDLGKREEEEELIDNEE